jgi:DNA-binding XRE family transcriptional regulator
VKTNLSPTPGKPLAIKRGNVTVKVYAGRNRVNGTNYQQFTVAYYDGAQRRKKRYADLEEAKREAKLAATKLANGEVQVLRLTSLDRANYLQALDTLRPLGRQLKAFGANVRRERMAKGLTQEKLAELVDLNIRTIQKIEAGHVNILLTTVLRLQKALDCSWESLMEK